MPLSGWRYIAFTLRTPQLPRHLARRAKRGCEGRGRVLPLSDGWSLTNAFRKVDFELVEISASSRYPILAPQCAEAAFGAVLLRIDAH